MVYPICPLSPWFPMALRGAVSSAWTAMEGRAAPRRRQCPRTGAVARSTKHHATLYLCILHCTYVIYIYMISIYIYDIYIYTYLIFTYLYIYTCIDILIYSWYMWYTVAYWRILSADFETSFFGLRGIYHIIHKRCWTFSKSSMKTRTFIQKDIQPAIMERVRNDRPSFVSVQTKNCQNAQVYQN